MTSGHNRLLTYTAPGGAAGITDFTVKVRQGQGEWQELFCYRVKVDMHHVRYASMVYFDFSGLVEIEVIKNEGEVKEAVLRPSSAGLDCVWSDNRITFTMIRPRKLSLEVNGDRFHNLHIFANPLEENVPDLADPGVIAIRPGHHCTEDLLGLIRTPRSEDGTEKQPAVLFFEPGMHVLEPSQLFIPSGITVYIAGGAVVVGALKCERVYDVKIRGRGILYMSDFEQKTYYRGVEINYSRNIAIEGIITVDPPSSTVNIGQSENVCIRNLKTFSTRGWTDGIDVLSSSHIEIDDVFLRTSDDCIAVYGTRTRFRHYGDSRNVIVRNAVLWADVAHPVMIGVHGFHERDGDILENLLFDNVDILEHHEPQDGYWGCMAINAGDKNTVRNVTFRNIRVEQFELGRLIDIRIFQNPKYNPSPGSRVENIRFENITFTGTCDNPSVIKGFDETRTVDGITFHNLRINGRHILSPESGNFVIGDHAHRIEFT
ncbi:glycosyl hydrolase family 28 protein [Paenibacillus tarimensis]